MSVVTDKPTHIKAKGYDEAFDQIIRHLERRRRSYKECAEYR